MVIHFITIAALKDYNLKVIIDKLPMSNKNIVFCMKWLKKGGGAEYITLEMINVLLLSGWAVSLYIKDYTEDEHVVDSRVKVIRCWSYKNMLKKIYDANPSHIFSADHKLASILVFYRFISFRKFKLTFRSITNLEKVFGGSKIKKIIARWLLPKCDKVIAQSEGMKMELCSQFCVPVANVVVIHNPQRRVGGGDLMIEKSNKDYMLFVGRLSKEKGILEYLLPVFAELLLINKKLKLYIAGDGHLRSDIESYISANHLDKSIFLLGFQHELNELYQGAICTVLTSQFEGFPNVLVESISNGTPIVSFDTPHGPKDIVLDKKNGFLVNFGDKEHLLQCLSHSITYKFNTEEIIISSQRFSYEPWRDKIINLFTEAG
jgi:glycosyltransferase involved in cell wall biosynthesis